ncbi:MAG: NADPH-dependent F420 reductase [Thaumarchaeota archaeon S15]|nr:MAG: NADPH-dependent F420 reductase [Thaumarchaeota archaeon S15]
MKIGIVGGTGAMGRGFALRWSPRHGVAIGSRDAGRAQASASEYDLLPRTRESCIVISPIVPMERTGAGFEFVPFRDGKKSAHDSVAAHMRDASRLVSAFHVISEKKLADPARALDYDIFVCGDSDECVEAVCGLVSDIEGLRALRLGGGSLAYMAEVATPLLLNAMVRNRLKSPGIKLV